MKYKLTDETIEINGHKLHRVKYSDTGKLGGWIEFEHNLSQEGDAQVLDDAWVYGNASVFGKVCDKAQVFGNAVVLSGAKVYGNAKVCGNAIIGDKMKVYGDGSVYSSMKNTKN